MVNMCPLIQSITAALYWHWVDNILKIIPLTHQESSFKLNWSADENSIHYTCFECNDNCFKRFRNYNEACQLLMSSVAFLHNILMVNIPTELIKPHSTGPLEAMARSTLSIELQHAFCILSLYWGKLSSCTTRRRSRTGVYTSGIWKKWKINRRDWRQLRDIALYSNVYYIIINDIMVGYLVQVNQDAGYWVKEAWQLVKSVFISIWLSQVHYLTALDQFCIHQVYILLANLLARLQSEKKKFYLYLYIYLHIFYICTYIYIYTHTHIYV